jgi:hypothetical protein
MKTLLCAITLFFISLTGFSQTLYDLQWSHDGTEYSGLMVFFNEDDIHMRLGYEEGEGYNVKNAEYVYMVDDELGEFVFLEAISSEFVQDEGGSADEVFHFIWVTDEDGQMMGPYAITEYELEHDKLDALVEVQLVELTAEELTKEYLLQYYLPEEEEYGLLAGSATQEEYTPPAGSGPVNLHFIVAANTKISDIGASTKMDMDNLASELSGIAEVLKMNYKQTEISGKEFTMEQLNAVLTNLKPTDNDMVVFYYSGHGFRYSDATVKYPQLDMRYNAYQEMTAGTSINLKEVKDIIEKKGGRLNIVLGDCCNNDIGLNKQVGTNFMASRANVNANVEKLSALFIKSKGTMIAAGADKGEYSWCSSQGGFFTNSLINALREETSALRTDDVANWEDIISKAKTGTRKKSDLCKECEPQNVIFEETIAK